MPAFDSFTKSRSKNKQQDLALPDFGSDKIESLRDILNNALGNNLDAGTKKSFNDNISSVLGDTLDGPTEEPVDLSVFDNIIKTSIEAADTDSKSEYSDYASGVVDPNDNTSGNRATTDFGNYTPDGFTTENGQATVSTKVSGLSKVLPGTAEMADSIASLFGKGTFQAGYRTRAADSIANGDHPKGNAYDWGAPNVAEGNRVVEYLINNAERFNVKYIIFAGRTWNRDRGFKPYVPPPGEGAHYDHVHVSRY